MARYQVVANVIVQARGLDPEGQPREGRHWAPGSQVELGPAEAEGLFQAGAIGPVPQAPAREPETVPGEGGDEQPASPAVPREAPTAPDEAPRGKTGRRG